MNDQHHGSRFTEAVAPEPSHPHTSRDYERDRALPEPPKCQIYCLKPMSGEVVKGIPKGMVPKVKVFLTRRLGPARKRALKRHLQRAYNAVRRNQRPVEQPVSPADRRAVGLQAGDQVRVKSREEIAAMVGLFSDLKGLVFMPEMWKYCGTEQRVMKRLTRFFDEREYVVRKAKGIVLLEGVMCEGTEMFGPCDRTCYFFWREEWLEKIDGSALDRDRHT